MGLCSNGVSPSVYSTNYGELYCHDGRHITHSTEIHPIELQYTKGVHYMYRLHTPLEGCGRAQATVVGRVVVQWGEWRECWPCLLSFEYVNLRRNFSNQSHL
jgi:hypothetical protein